MNFNWQAPPQTSASDREKFKINQDDIIAIQIANDANIANARNQQFVLKTPQSLTPIESMSPEQLLSDEAGNEMLAQQNLKMLKFRDQEVADIMINIRRDPQLSFTLLNSNFPAIKAELEKRFNLKLVTPTFFIDFLKAYLAKVSKSLGLTQYSRSKNDSVDTVEEIRTIIPDRYDLEFLRQHAINLNYSVDNIEKLDDLINQFIPTERDYENIALMDPVDRQESFRNLLETTKDLPTASQVRNLVEGIENGVLDRRTVNNAMMKLLNSIDITLSKPVFRQFEQEQELPEPIEPPPYLSEPIQLRPVPEPTQPRQFKVPKMEDFKTPVKPTRNFMNDPQSLPLKDIKDYFKQNPGIAAQLKDTRSGEKLRYTKLTKSRTSKGVSIYDTNLIQIWGQEEPPTTEGFGLGNMNSIQRQPKNPIRIGRGIAAV
jgi:hypothetical protein